MHGHGRDVAHGLHIPDFTEEFFLRIHMVRMPCQECQQVELLGRKGPLLAVHPHAPRGGVDLQAADLDHFILLHVAADQPLVTGQMRLHAGNQLAGAERLGHIIIRAEPQAADLVDIVLLRGHHDDRGVLLIPDLPADLKTVHTGQHQVQDDQVKIPVKPHLKAGLTVIGHFHFKAAQFQIIFLKISDALFIFYDQNTLTHQSVPPDIF